MTIAKNVIRFTKTFFKFQVSILGLHDKIIVNRFMFNDTNKTADRLFIKTAI